MNLNTRKLNIALILIYLACVIFTAYTLFQLQDDLVYSSQTLSISDIAAAKPVIIKLNLIVGITLLIGFGALVFLFKNRNEEVIYVEKKKLTGRNNEDGEDDEDDEHKQFSTAFINDILKNEKDEQKILDKTLNGICKKLEAGMGIVYRFNKTGDKNLLQLKSSYAVSLGESQVLSYEMGEGLVGQVAKERQTMVIDDIPEGYIKIVSGLGKASPTHLLISPIEQGNHLFGVIEIASFTAMDKAHQSFVKNCLAKVTEILSDKEDKTKKAPKENKVAEKKESGKGKKA